MTNRLQAWVLRCLLWCLGVLSPAMASSLSGFLFRTIGPHLPSSRVAAINLRRAFPDMGDGKKRNIIRGCWENLGRTLGELPHLPTLPANSATGPGWQVHNAHILQQARDSGRAVIFFSGHMGNWELMPLVVARYGLGFASFYRAPNNPFVDQLLCHLRRRISGQETPFFPKGRQGAREAVRHLAKGGHLGVLGDQKMNDGIEVSFFDHPTMTAPAAAALALRFEALIITGHVWRDGPARLVLEVSSCLDPKSLARQPRHDMIHHLTQRLNDELEGWITERPESWLWLHRRWDKALYRLKEQ